MKKVITYGTFDVLHSGHLNLLHRARVLGEHLTVGVSTDEFNFKKSKKSLLPFEERLTVLRAIRYVDEVIPETCWEQKISDITDRSIDVFVIGNDWAGQFDFLRPFCDVVYLTRTPDISSTILRSRLHGLMDEH